MIHKKCGGRVLVDRLMSEKQHVELACLMCGERWMLNKEKSRLAQWVFRLETMRENATVVVA